jgi:quercetin dioxygenase-like cupin family protein
VTSSNADDPAVVPVDLRDYVVFGDEQATRVRVVASERLALDLWCLQPRQATPVLHFEDQDVSYTVVAGRSWFVTDAGEIGLDPLGAMLVPAGVVHGIDNRGADPLIVVASVTPPGEGVPDQPATPEAAAVRFDPDAPGRMRTALRALFGRRPGR